MGFFRVHLGLAATLLLPIAARALTDVTVVVDMTPEGRKVAHPSPDHPVYYKPTMGTFHELGNVNAGEKSPSVHPLVHLVAVELAKQGYVVAIDHTPDLVVDLSWGYLNPGARAISSFLNKVQANALVLGHTIANVTDLSSYDHERFMDAAYDDRYFVVVTAFDYHVWVKQHRRLVLWKAKMSVPKAGFFFDDVAASLVKAGGPFFGRETVDHPKITPVIPDGQVEVGTPTVTGVYEPNPGHRRQVIVKRVSVSTLLS